MTDTASNAERVAHEPGVSVVPSLTALRTLLVRRAADCHDLRLGLPDDLADDARIRVLRALEDARDAIDRAAAAAGLVRTSRPPQAAITEAL